MSWNSKTLKPRLDILRASLARAYVPQAESEMGSAPAPGYASNRNSFP